MEKKPYLTDGIIGNSKILGTLNMNVDFQKRYYIGGNPWILTTPWLALYKIKERQMIEH